MSSHFTALTDFTLIVTLSVKSKVVKEYRPCRLLPAQPVNISSPSTQIWKSSDSGTPAGVYEITSALVFMNRIENRKMMVSLRNPGILFIFYNFLKEAVCLEKQNGPYCHHGILLILKEFLRVGKPISVNFHYINPGTHIQGQTEIFLHGIHFLLEYPGATDIIYLNIPYH